MIKKLLWGLVYMMTFVVAFTGGIAVNILSNQNFAGIEDVEWDDSMWTIETDLAYADGPLNRFDLYLPADKANATKLVLYIHAGGFTGGDKADDAAIAQSFAAKGYVAATINYSLRSDTNQTNVMEMTHEIDEGVDAIVATATERGYDLDGMVIGGGSAGGNLALTYAYRDAADAPVPVEAVISLVGPASFEPAAWFGFDDGYASDDTAEAGAGFVSIITGEQVTPDMMRSGDYEQYLKPVSPLMLVTPDAPPTLLAYGELDKVAPYAASQDLPGVLAENDVPYDALIFPDSGHALNRDPEMGEQLGVKFDEYLDRYAPLG
ncbi:alpha/beta hydrolase [Nocardiopsis sp. CNS-639]|uniref:alpha/beta hydrolase n=1 Tax=Nocardiopsis sp. CNS-639 TaxID=1169153 RepID=UPI000365787A|nr:alpha/beta hydrolase [Nocardiopsis sp. CNS-639]